MKTIKQLFLILLPPLFTLLVSWAVSMTNEFNWKGVIFFMAITTLLGIVLAIRCPQRLTEPTLGWFFSGGCYALISAKGMLGVYIPLFEFIASVIFAFTMFFLYIPTIMKPKDRSHKGA